MIYVCIPAQNHADTIGLLLWKIRQVFASHPREYHLLLATDGATDATPEVLQSYQRVLPLSVTSHEKQRGYAATLEGLLREALRRTDRPRRDLIITLPPDFSVSPTALPQLIKRIESGADVVVGEAIDGDPSIAGRVVRRLANRLLRPGVNLAGAHDLLSGVCAIRMSTIKRCLRERSGKFFETEERLVHAELVARASAHARQIALVRIEPAHLRPASVERVRPVRLAWALLRAGRRVRIPQPSVPVLGILAFALAPQASSAQTETAQELAPPDWAERFPVGEKLSFDARFGIVNVGNAAMHVVARDTVRADSALHLQFTLDGGLLGLFRLHDQFDSWVGLDDLSSRRFTQVFDETGNQRTTAYEIFPDSGIYWQEGVDTANAASEDPLDDTAFFYFVRALELEPGQRHEFNRYFRRDRNPVIIEVLERDTVDVPAGRFPTVNKNARMWISDDDRRLIVQMKSRFAFGTITLRLTDIEGLRESGVDP